MNILIDCANYFAHGGVNLGDVAVLRAMRIRLAHLFPNATSSAFTAAPDSIKRHVPGLIPIKVTDTNSRGSDPLYAQSAEKAVENASMVLLSGGGFFSDHFARHATALLETLSSAQSKNIPTAIMFPGIEPVQDAILVTAARATLPKVGLIGCREALVSPGILASFGVKKQVIEIGFDDVVEVAYSEMPIDKNEDSIGFVLRQSDYAGVDKLNADQIAAAFLRATTELRQQAIILPINLNMPSDGRASHDALTNAGLSIGNPSIDSLESLFAAIDRCRVVVTGSYHAGVFALSRGRPVVALIGSAHYRQKFNGLAAYFEGACTVVELNDGFESKLIEAIFSAWSSAHDQRETIFAAVRHHLFAQRASWNRLRELL